MSVKTGTGTLGGTLNGTILAGTSQVTIGLATYTKAESGVVLTAARTSGDTLIAGDTAPFTVSPGAAARLAFTTQPGNAGSQEHNSRAANGHGTRQCRQYRHVLDPLDQHRNRDQPRCWNS